MSQLPLKEGDSRIYHAGVVRCQGLTPLPSPMR